MTTLDKSQQIDFFGMELDPTLLPEDFRAKTSQLLANNQELTESEVDYGPSLPVLLASYNRDTQSWKTSQTSLVATADDGLDEFSETWPRSGMTRNGIAYQLPRLAPTTTEIGSGLFPTPNASTGGTTGNWKAVRPSGHPAQMSLQQYVRIWPTPSTRDYKGGYSGGRIRNGKVSWDTLDVAVQYTDNQNKNSGSLNPTWVEWLMGFPLGHTDLKPLETQ